MLFAKVNAGFSKSCEPFLLSISRNFSMLCCVETLNIKIPYLKNAVGITRFMISIPSKIIFGWSNKNTEIGWACGTYGTEERCIQDFGAKTRGKERPRSRRKDNIKIRLQDIGWGFGWTVLVLDRDTWKACVSVVTNFRISLSAENVLTSWGSLSFSRRVIIHGVNWLIS